MSARKKDTIQAAYRAVEEGYHPVPITNGNKRPYGVQWEHDRYTNDEEGKARLKERFEDAQEHGAEGIGLILGKPSGGLVDVDLDHSETLRLQDYFLPSSRMVHGRAGRPLSHRWYIVTGTIPSTRRYKMPDRSTSIELRSTGSQTVIPPTMHPDNEEYVWEGEPWGGEDGPETIDGQKLAIQVAVLALAAVVIENWPKSGSRHDAYLALAGGLLREGDTVHPFWENNLEVLIRGLADATHDKDGATSRVNECIPTTIKKIRNGEPAAGFPSLAEIIGEDHVNMVRRLADEIESLSGYTPEVIRDMAGSADALGESYLDSGEDTDDGSDDVEEPDYSNIPMEKRDPLNERVSTWAAVDMEPYLSGKIEMPKPSVLRREDNQGLLYPGRVNMLFGKSESAKSWVCMYACVQEMNVGERTLYMDMEDEPAGTLARMRALGAADEDIMDNFRYIRPEGPLSDMQRSRFGSNASPEGKKAHQVFNSLLDSYDPTLIIVDGMTALYGLHGQDTNDAMSTDIITTWLKSLTRGGRSTVVVIDHTGKTGGAGASPIGAHHKIAMVQGTALRVDPVIQPMPGELGHVKLIVYKDRPGAVRAVSTKTGDEQVACDVYLDSTTEGITRVSVKAPDSTTFILGNTDDIERKLPKLARMEEHKEKILNFFAGDMDYRASSREVSDATGIEISDLYDVWKSMRMDKTIIREGVNRHTRFRLASPEETR